RLSELAVIEEENNVSKKIKSYEEKINKLENNINCLSDNTIYTSISYEKSKNLEFRKNNYLEAINLYTEYLNKRQSYVIFSNRAACYHKLNMYDEAIHDCLSGLKINKSFFKFYLRLGVVHEIKKEIQKAKEFYTTGMEFENHVEIFKKQLNNLEEISEITLKE
ncbi:cre-sgt-1 protein, partial [Vairimorpha apis BRL 01]